MRTHEHENVATMSRIVSVHDVTSVGERLRIARLDLHGEAFAYIAGQAVRVSAPGSDRRGVFSIASPPEMSRRQRIIELLVSTPRSHADCLPFTQGRTVTIEGPVGTFTFPTSPSQRQFVFIAGGTGIAPIRAMITQALRVPHATAAILYSARTVEDFAFPDELRSLAMSGLVQLKQTVTRDGTPEWSGSRGRFGPEDLRPFVGGSATLWFLCGPDGLIHEMRRHLSHLGVGRGQIRTESA